MEIYDLDYINDKIIGGIEKNLPVVSEILRKLEKKATGKVTSALCVTGGSSQGDNNTSDTASAMTGTN